MLYIFPVTKGKDQEYGFSYFGYFVNVILEGTDVYSKDEMLSGTTSVTA